MRFSLIFILFFLANAAFAQVKVTGRVIDEKTNQPIPAVSVYLNNTTFGGKTDASGNFSFSCTLSGEANLIISHVAYERKVLVIDLANTTNLSFSLKPHTNNLNEVVIMSNHSKANLTKWINLFTHNFIGAYIQGSQHCKIKNTNALFFDFDRSTNILQVFARDPLVVQNDFLSYTIKIDLERFEYDFNNNEVIFKYFAFYENSANPQLTSRQVVKNRLFAYEGSAMHFMRSVFNNSLESEWFALQKYTTQMNKEKARVEAIIRKKTAQTYAQSNAPNVTLSNLFSGDTLAYYKTILSQKNTIKFEGVALNKFTTKDKATRTVNLSFPDSISVTYDKNKLNREKKISAMIAKNKQNQVVEQPIYLYTYMYFFKEGGINIQANGYYPELRLFMDGDMAERRLALSLPYDFDPKNVKD